MSIIVTIYRWFAKKCMDCGGEIDNGHIRGEVCDTCFDEFNGATIDDIMECINSE